MTDTAGSGGGVKLQIQDATKNFGGVRAVANVSADVQEGEVFAISGPNGAGKTTMLNMISGFYHPDGGSILFEGRDISQTGASNIAALGIGRTFQNIALFRGMTVLENLMLGRHVLMKSGVLASFLYWGPAQREEVAHRERVEEIIDFLNLTDLRKAPTGALAYGLQKRVELVHLPRRGSLHLLHQNGNLHGTRAGNWRRRIRGPGASRRSCRRGI